MKKIFNFSIVVGGVKITSDNDLFDISDALHEAGCDDAHPAAFGGTLYINFDRESESYEKAVMSAIADIESVPGLVCLSVDLGGLVSLSDAAEMAGVTKAALSRYSKGTRGKGNFPSPLARVSSQRPLWSWKDIANWLETSGALEQQIVEQAKETDAINTALTLRRSDSLNTVTRYISELSHAIHA